MKNCLVFTVDTLRYDAIEALNDGEGTLAEHGLAGELSTSNMNELVEEGVVLPNLHSQYGSTPTSVSTILSGLYPREHKVYGYFQPLDPDVTLLPEYFSREGFYTIQVNGHPLFEPIGISRQFDEVISGPTERLVKRIKDLNEKGERVFAYYHTMDVHDPYLMSQYPSSPDYHDIVIEIANQLCQQYGESRRFDRSDVQTDTTEDDVPLYAPIDSALWKFMKDNVVNHFRKDEEIFTDPLGTLMQFYVAGVNQFDRLNFQSVRDFLLEDPDGRETVCLLTSDHGEIPKKKNERMSFGHKGKPREELIRVPGVLVNAPVEEDRIQSHELTGLVDVTPTMMDLFEIDVPDSISGVKLTENTEERVIYAEYSQSFLSLTDSDFLDTADELDRVFPLPAVLKWESIIDTGGLKYYRLDRTLDESDYEKSLREFIRISQQKILSAWVNDDSLDEMIDQFGEDTRSTRKKYVRNLQNLGQELGHSEYQELYRWTDDRYEEDNLFASDEVSTDFVVSRYESLLDGAFPHTAEITTAEVEKETSDEEITEALEGMGYL